MNSDLRDEQQAQEDEFELPYHHLSGYSPSFRPGFVDAWAMNYNHSVELVLEQLQHYSPRSVLDIGCGDGRITREVRLRFPGIKSLGIDYSERAIAHATLMDPDGRYAAIDICGDGLKERFDFGLLIEVFEHIPPAECPRFVEGIAAAIPEDGRLLVTVPHVNKPIEYKHFRHFTAESLCESFAGYFVPEHTLYIEKLGLANWLMNKLVVNQFFILNQAALLDRIYRAYGKWIFRASSEKECARVAVVFRRTEKAIAS